MSYFNQRKKEERADKILFYGLIVIAVFSILGFFIQNISFLSFINDWRFLYIVICFLIMIFAPFLGRWLSFVVALLFFTINIITVHSSTSISYYGGHLDEENSNIKVLFDDNSDSFIQDYDKLSSNGIDFLFLNFTQEGKGFVRLDSADYKYKYISDKISNKRSAIYSKRQAIEAGHVVLSKNLVASWAVFKINKRPYLFINSSHINREDVFKSVNIDYLDNLAKFINSRDEAVILIANTGFVSWSKNQREFMNKVSLTVRSGITLNNNISKFKLFRHPTTNLLAFNELKFEDIDLVKNKIKKQDNYSILFDIILP
jgi:hypothetical protein